MSAVLTSLLNKLKDVVAIKHTKTLGTSTFWSKLGEISSVEMET